MFKKILTSIFGAPKQPDDVHQEPLLEPKLATEPEETVTPPPTPQPEKKPRKPRTKKKPPEKTPKEIATENDQPYVNIVSMNLDPDDVNNGSFELDWNDKFISNLIRAGYQKAPNDTDTDLVDRWFQEICRNVALEVYEQHIADPSNRVQ